MMEKFNPSPTYIAELVNNITFTVQSALAEDIGSGDITAALIPSTQRSHAIVITREPMILCGVAWVEEVFAQLDPTVKITWHASEGDFLETNQRFLELEGNSRHLLSGERVCLNFLQLLSGVATRVHTLMQTIKHTQAQLLDTRKTIPCLRLAQKYAVTVGGGKNHRLALYDAFLIKENHILAAGGIASAIEQAQRIAPGKPIEVETENFTELEEALNAGANIIMLDNFSYADMEKAVQWVAGRCKLEASGNITADNLATVAATGVDYISMGTLTKDVKAIDLSMRMTHNIGNAH